MRVVVPGAWTRMCTESQPGPEVAVSRKPGFNWWGPGRLPGKRASDQKGGVTGREGGIPAWAWSSRNLGWILEKDRIYQDKTNKISQINHLPWQGSGLLSLF